MTFEQRVKESFASLSPGQKKVAEYLLENMEKAAFSTAVQIGREVDVSETTVIRLSYALGFSGFSEMQSVIQQDVLKSSSTRPVDHGIDAAEEMNPFVKVVERDIAILRQMISQINQDDLRKAGEWLMEADCVLVVGYRASYAAAHWFSFMLSEFRDDVMLCPSTGERMEKLVNLSDRSVAFIISYPRYTKETVKLAEYAKQRGARIIAATDRVLSPVGRLSDISFTTEINIESGANSVASVISLLNLIMAEIGMKHQAEIQLRRKHLEQLYSSFGVFVE